MKSAKTEDLTGKPFSSPVALSRGAINLGEKTSK